MTTSLTSVTKLLERRGILLLQDATLPNLVGEVAGGPVRGSWWSHPKGAKIFKLGNALERRPEVTTTKLVSGKVTFVHARLFPHLVALGSAQESWQIAGLDGDATALLRRVQEEHEVVVTGKAAKQLERAVLVASQQVHLDSGRHALRLTTWAAFARRAGLPDNTMSATEARAQLASEVSALNHEFGARGKLPWPSDLLA